MIRKEFQAKLSQSFSDREAMNITDYYYEAHIGLEIDSKKLQNDLVRLAQGEPVQYVTETSFFYGYKFYVNQHVLIPRPESEELVHWVVTDEKRSDTAKTILDIGAGSGCIGLSIKKNLTSCHLILNDISPEAITVCQRNAKKYNLKVELCIDSILAPNECLTMNKPDVIVSNPPYIIEEEYNRLDPSVIKYEPHLALFSESALMFYKAILDYAKNIDFSGAIYFETSDIYHQDMERLVRQYSEEYEFRKDLQDKWRMLKVSF